MKKETREALAEILARYLVTPTSFDHDLLSEVVNSIPALDPLRNAVESAIAVAYHDDTTTMDYVWNSHDMA